MTAPSCRAVPTRRRSPTTSAARTRSGVVTAESVTTTDGTGLVHTAGAFGEERQDRHRPRGHRAGDAGRQGRQVHPPGRRVRRPAGLRRQPADHRRPEADHPGGARGQRHRGHRAAAPRDLRPLLPALLALPGAADLQGRLVLVRRGDRVQGADARAQPGDPLGARAHQGGPVRQVAGERPRLVDHPQPVLGVAGAGVAQRRPDVPTDRRLRQLRGARARLRRPAARQGRQPRPAPALRRRAGPPQPRRPDRQVDDAPGARRAGRLVRLRLDELRAGAPPVRERRVVRAPLPGGLHRGVHRADPRLVLHAAHPGQRDLRPAGVLDLRLARDRARLRRQQDVEVAAQLPQRLRGLRPRRRRRDALVPDVVADPARRQPDRHRAGHPRLGAPGADPAVEQLVLLRALRQRGGGVGLAVDGLRGPARPLPAGQVPAVRRGDDRAARQLRGGQRLRLDAGVPRRAHQLVHPPVAGAVLGDRRRGRPGGVRHALHGARDRVPAHRAAAAADLRGGLARPDRRPLGAPRGLARRRLAARRRGAGQRDGPGARRLLRDLRAPQGGVAAQPAAAVDAQRRGVPPRAR